MKDQIKAPRTKLSHEEIANLSDGEFKALVIKMFTEQIELGQEIKEQMKDTQNEIKQNILTMLLKRNNGISSLEMATVLATRAFLT